MQEKLEKPFFSTKNNNKWKIQDSYKHVMKPLQTYSSDKSPIRFNPLPWYLSYGTQGESIKIRVVTFQPAHFAQGSSLPFFDIFHVLWTEHSKVLKWKS